MLIHERIHQTISRASVGLLKKWRKITLCKADRDELRREVIGLVKDAYKGAEFEKLIQHPGAKFRFRGLWVYWSNTIKPGEVVFE